MLPPETCSMPFRNSATACCTGRNRGVWPPWSRAGRRRTPRCHYCRRRAGRVPDQAAGRRPALRHVAIVRVQGVGSSRRRRQHRGCHAALTMLGHTNIVTEVGHHAPGFYSAMFIDGSLEDMGIGNMHELQARFRERDGLLGHLSGAIPGLLHRQGLWVRASISRWPAPTCTATPCSRAPSVMVDWASPISCRPSSTSTRAIRT